MVQTILKLKSQGISFQPDGHTYTGPDGKLLTGVTTILQVRAKDFLKWWTAKEMYNFLLPRLAEVQGIDEKKWEDLLMEGKKAHLTKSKDALDIGHQVHDWIENYAKWKIKGAKPETKLPEDEKVAHSIKSFLLWETKHEVEWLASELVVASIKNSFAGTLDGLAKVDGKLTLIDFKTSSQISEDYYLQTGAYQIALEEMGIVPEQRLILRIPKDGSPVEDHLVPTPLDFDKETFLHLREVYRWNLNYENNVKPNKL